MGTHCFEHFIRLCAQCTWPLDRLLYPWYETTVRFSEWFEQKNWMHVESMLLCKMSRICIEIIYVPFSHKLCPHSCGRLDKFTIKLEPSTRTNMIEINSTKNGNIGWEKVVQFKYCSKNRQFGERKKRQRENSPKLITKWTQFENDIIEVEWIEIMVISPN